MPADEILRAGGYSLLLAGFLFLVRWWAETKGQDRTARDRKVALARQPTLLQLAPIVIGAPSDTQRESLLISGRARRVVTTQRPAHHSDS